MKTLSDVMIVFFVCFFLYSEFLVQNAKIGVCELFSVWLPYFSSLFAIIGHLFDGHHLIGVGVTCL